MEVEACKGIPKFKIAGITRFTDTVWRYANEKLLALLIQLEIGCSFDFPACKGLSSSGQSLWECPRRKGAERSQRGRPSTNRTGKRTC